MNLIDFQTKRRQGAAGVSILRFCKKCFCDKTDTLETPIGRCHWWAAIGRCLRSATNGCLDFARHPLSKSRIQCSSKPNIFEAGDGLDFVRHALSKSRFKRKLHTNRVLFLVFLIAAPQGGNQKNQKQKTKTSNKSRTMAASILFATRSQNRGLNENLTQIVFCFWFF